MRDLDLDLECTDPKLLTRRLGALLLVVATACGPDVASESTEAEPTTAGSTEAEVPTTGEPAPVVDCEAVPTVLDAPAWRGEPELGGSRVAAAGDGDVLFLRGSDVLDKFGADGVAWTHSFAEDEAPAVMASLPDGRVVVGGTVHADGGWETRLFLFGADGQPLASEIVDQESGRDESLVAMGVSSLGEIAAVIRTSTAGEPGDPQEPGDARLRVDRYDDALGLVWSVDGGAYRFEPAVDVDADGDVYVATQDLVATSKDGFAYTWALAVRSFDAGGERWAAAPVEIETDNNVPGLVVSVGDQVYVLQQRPAAFVFMALSTAGEPVWTWTRDDQDPPSEAWLAGHTLQSVAASPCGGVYVGGHSDVDVEFVAGAASLFHVAADGTPGPITNVLEMPHDGTFEHFDAEAIDVTPLGRIVAVGSLRAVFPNEAANRVWVQGF